MSSSSMSRLASSSSSAGAAASRSGTPSTSSMNAAAGPSTANSNAALAALAEAERERSPEPDEDFRMDEQPTAWLVKVPRFLYEGWSQITQDDLNLGKVRVYDADHRGKQRIELILPSAPDAPIPLPEYDPAVAGRDVKRIPRNYDVKLSSDASETTKRNLFAFKEMAEEGDGDTEIEDAGEGEGGEGGVGEDDDEDDDDDQAMGGRSKANGNAKGKRQQAQRPGYRRKRAKITTAFAGKITNEASVKPLLSSLGSGSALASNTSRSASPSLAAAGPSSSAAAADSKVALGLSTAHADRKASFTPEYRDILRRRKEEATKPKRAVKMLDETSSGANNMLMAGLGQGHVRGSKGQPTSFIVGQGGTNLASSAGARGGKASGSGTSSSSSKDKFTRLPKNELLDLLFHCYERYTYWTLKALREETRQPEAYLRDVLVSIADQHKRGPYVGQWSLKAEYVEQQRRMEEENQQRAAMQAQQAAGMTGQQQGGQGQGSGAQDDVTAGEGGGDGDDEDMEEVI